MARRKKTNKFIRHFIIILLIIGYYYIKDIQESHSNKEEIVKQKENIKEVSTDLSIYYIDVGEADSIFITNNGYSMLIDGGENEDGKLVVNYLKEELNVTKIDYVVGTHPHEDHIGGLDDVINYIEVNEVYLPDSTTTTKTFEDLLDAIENKELSITIPEIGEKFSLGEMDFEVIYTGTGEKDLNEASIVLKMTFGKYKYLFTGDTTKQVEKKILDRDIDIDVLKVSHHGDRNSTCKEFLEATTPEYAIISVSEDNHYGHPVPETIERIKEYTEKIYMTKDLGTIVLTSDGTSIQVNNYQTNTNG